MNIHNRDLISAHRLIQFGMQVLPPTPVRYVPRSFLQFSICRASFAQFGYGNVALCSECYVKTRSRRKSLCAKASRCPPRFRETPHSRSLHGDATKAISLLSRARTPKPRDARARNSSIALCAAGGPRSAGIGRGPRAGPDGSAIFRSPLRRVFGMASPPRSASETT